MEETNTLPRQPSEVCEQADNETGTDAVYAEGTTVPFPEENVTRITYQDKEILLIGTAHVSQDSVALVRSVIEQERPDSVCIELDQDRYSSLKNPAEIGRAHV